MWSRSCEDARRGVATGLRHTCHVPRMYLPRVSGLRDRGGLPAYLAVVALKTGRRLLTCQYGYCSGPGLSPGEFRQLSLSRAAAIDRRSFPRFASPAPFGIKTGIIPNGAASCPPARDRLTGIKP